MTTIHIRDQETDEIVHSIETEYPPDSSQYERTMSGLYRKVDFDRFYVEEPE
jgi:hypothetical protein